MNMDDKLTTGEKIELRSHSDDPNWERANALLKQIDQVRTERTVLLQKANQLGSRIDTLESELRRLFLELVPTEVIPTAGIKRQKGGDLDSRIKKLLLQRLAETPSLQEQIDKILNGNK